MKTWLIVRACFPACYKETALNSWLQTCSVVFVPCRVELISTQTYLHLSNVFLSEDKSWCPVYESVTNICRRK